jgi:segregation and condensation protein B
LTELNLKHIIEAILFASEEELSLKQIKDLLDMSKVPSSLREIEESINSLNTDYENNGSAFRIIRIAGGFQFATLRDFAEYIGKMKSESQRKKLSQSALETLAIIAYKQPITRSEIEFIRGVNVDYIVNSLLEKDLIMIKGRATTPGRPILYGTTNNFLKLIGIESIEDLPKLREINEILKSEKIEGITEADIDLFNSMTNQDESIPEGQAGFDFTGVKEGEESTSDEAGTEENPDENLNDEIKTEDENRE